MSFDEKPNEKKKLDEARKSEGVPTGASKEARVLLNPEEWKEPVGRKVIGEYHKDGLPESAAGSESDLDSFEQYWKARGKSKVRSEYHKEGAPYMEAPQELDGHMFQVGETVDKIVEKITVKDTPAGRILLQNADTTSDRKDDSKDSGNEGGKDGIKDDSKNEEKGPLDTEKTADSSTHQPPIERVIDVATIEVLALTIFRVIFGRGVRVPLKREGVVDMDIVVNDKDVLLNTNEVLFEVPELSVWRFIIAYKGKPVLEYGRGVKRRIRIYYYRMFLLLLAMWWMSWKKRRVQAKVHKSETRAGETKRKVLMADDH